MTLLLEEALAVAANDGDKFISTASVLTFNSIVISFDTALPRTWDFLGTMYREVLINDEWTIISSHVITPGRPSVFTWDDTAPYRLSFRLVKYIYAGNLLIYSYNAPSPLELSPVAYSGSYNDLTDKPTPFQPFTYTGITVPATPANNDTWRELDATGQIVEEWQYDSILALWLSIANHSAVSNVITASSTVLSSASLVIGRDAVVKQLTAMMVRGSTVMNGTNTPTFNAVVKNLASNMTSSTGPINLDLGNVSGPSAQFLQNTQNFRKTVTLNHFTAGLANTPHPRTGLVVEVTPSGNPPASVFWFNIKFKLARV